MVTRSLKVRRTGLLVITSLTVCYVRHRLQYGHPPWAAGVVWFLATWLMHYLAVLGVCALVLVVAIKSDPFFFPGRPKRTTDELIHDTIVNVCITLIAASLLVWFFYLLPESHDAFE
jgi:hypothetical protein